MTPKRTLPATPLLGAFLLASCALTACERSDPAQQAINTAGEKLEAQSVGGGNPVFADNSRKKTLNEVITSLNSILSDSDPGKSAAAAVLISRAKVGLGEISSKEASSVEHRFIAETGVSRSLVDQWNSQHASAAAASKYDPSKDLADLDKAIAAQNADAAKREADKAAQERVVTEIQARADSARSAAKRERDREAAIRKTAEGQSQTAREDIIRQAVEASRAADALDMQASELSAEAAKEQPKVNEINSEIERLHSHADSLKKAKENIQQRADAARQQSTTAQHDADAVGKPITDTLAELNKLRDTAATPSSDAQQKYEEAVGAVKKSNVATAAKETKSAAQAALGAAQQSLGDLLSTKARSLDLYAATLDAVAKSSPPAPGAADASKKAEEVRNELKNLRDQAKASYVQARASYKNVSGSPEIKKKLEDIDKALEELSTPHVAAAPAPTAAAPETKPEVSKPEDMAAADKPAAPATAALTPEQAKAVEDEVRATLREIATAGAANDFEKVMAHIQTKSDEEKQVLLAALPLGRAAKALDAACAAKWGKDVAGLVKDSKVPAVKMNPMFMMLGALTGKGPAAGASAVMDSDAAEKAAIKPLTLTDAEVTVPNAPASTKFKKDGDVWKITGLGAMLGGGMGAQALPMAKSLMGAFTDATAGTTSGKYATADDMLTELSAKLMGAMGGMGGKPSSSPGGQKPPSGGGG